MFAGAFEFIAARSHRFEHDSVECKEPPGDKALSDFPRQVPISAGPALPKSDMFLSEPGRRNEQPEPKALWIAKRLGEVPEISPVVSDLSVGEELIDDPPTRRVRIAGRRGTMYELIRVVGDRVFLKADADTSFDEVKPSCKNIPPVPRWIFSKPFSDSLVPRLRELGFDRYGDRIAEDHEIRKRWIPAAPLNRDRILEAETIPVRAIKIQPLR